MSMLPESWKCDVDVVRNGGRDSRGNPLPVQRFTVKRVLVGQSTTLDPVDNSDAPRSRTLLYAEPDAEVTQNGAKVEGFRFESTDVIEVPATARMRGKWAVDGDPGEWPYGTELWLVRP